MKKILLAVALTGLVATAFGQGNVQFRNFLANPAINAPVFLDAVGGTALAGTAYRAALVGAPLAGADAWTLTHAGNLQLMYYGTGAATTLTWVNFRTGTGTPPAAAGYVNVGNSAGRAVPGADWGTHALVQMVAWEGNYNTWQEAWDAARGGTVRIGVSGALDILLPASAQSTALSYLGGLQSFAIQYVPEPTALGLGLCAAALLIFRRRS